MEEHYSIELRRELAQDLNNFGELAELVPVEDFFLNYLETLEDKAGVGGVAGVGGRNAGASAHTNVAPDVQPAPAAVGSGTRAGGPSDQDTFDEEDDENSPGSSGAPQSRPGSKRSRSGRAASGGGSRYRSAKQQLLNKQAQQRYRERKKQRQAELEVAVEDLSRKVKELEKQRLEAEALRARTVELEKALVAKEAEVSRVRLELQHSAPGAHSAENWCAGLPDPPQSSGAACAPADGLAGKAAAGAPAPGSKMSCAEKLNRLFSEQVVELREYWTAQGLDAIMEQQMSEGGKLEGAEAELEKGMLQRMDNICTTCMYTLRAEGLRIEDVLERDDVKRGKLPSSAESRDLWRRVVSALKLSDDQKARIMHMRERSLRSLRETYLERHRLNARAIAALARKVQGFIDNAGDSLAFPCLEDGTLAQRQHENIKLADLLDKIRENLRAEQRTLAELQVVVHRKILTPLQGCKAVLEAYPYHCDTLAMCNTLAASMGHAEASDSGAGNSHGATRTSGGVQSIHTGSPMAAAS